MEDTELYTRILGLRRPWSVSKVELNLEQNRVDVWAVEEPRWDWQCPICGKSAPVYDHAGEQTWRHLDTCEYETHLHARLVRTNCAEHGVKQVPAQWTGPRSPFTMKLEARLIDLLKEPLPVSVWVTPTGCGNALSLAPYPARGQGKMRGS